MSLPPNMKQVTTELTSDGMAGGDRTPKRIVLRSPKAVAYVCYGLQLWLPRGSSAMSHTRTVIGGRVTLDSLSRSDVRNTLIDAFGPGADEAAILAQRSKGRGTILVDGGGDPFGPTDAQVKEYLRVHKLLHSADRSVDLTGMVKTCCQCGGNLIPHTASHQMGAEIKSDHPRSLEDCQRLTNQMVISVHGYRDHKREEYVERFQTWDGESYQDNLFCSDGCATKYGRRAAIELPPLPADNSEIAEPRHSFESTDHYEKKDRTASIGGRVFKI